MKLVTLAPQPAAVLAFRESGWHGYMQEFPFLNGSQPDLDRDILGSLAGAITMRCPSMGCEVERYSSGELRLRPEVEWRVLTLLRRIGLSEDAIAAAVHRLAWKVREVRPDTKAILDFGCGDGVELLFLRAAAPGAQIVAIDWKDGLKAGVRDFSGIRFHAANILEYLNTTADKFDLIFSNHVIEHMYDPDAVCAAIRHLLNPGGLMLAALPLDGAVGSLWTHLKEIQRFPSPLALGAVDLGHPWKTTPADLRETLLSAGFASVRCIQRQGALNAAVVGDEQELLALETRGQAFFRASFGILNRLTRTLFGRRPPRALVKLTYALERRVWFGSNNLKNTVAAEILTIASL